MTGATGKRRRLDLSDNQWASIMLIVALAWGTVELLFLGARPYALTFISGVILSVPGRMIDKARKAVHAATEDRKP